MHPPPRYLLSDLHQVRQQRIQVAQRQQPASLAALAAAAGAALQRARQAGKVLNQQAVEQLQALAVVGVQLGRVHDADAPHKFA